MAAGDDNPITYNDAFELWSTIQTETNLDPTKNIHTRVMVEDVNATGYSIESSSLSSGTRFSSFDKDAFAKTLNKQYLDEVRAGSFFDSITSENNGAGQLTIKATSSSNGHTITLAQGASTDEAFLNELAKWGITIKYPYGRVYYLDSETDEEESVEIISSTEFSRLCNSSSSWTATIGGSPGVTVSNNGTNPITGIEMPSAVTSVGSYFLYNCVYLSREIDLSNLTSIGSHFLEGCVSFNHPLTLNRVTNIPQYFLSDCTNFNSRIDATSATWIDNGFLSNCLDFNSTLNTPNVSAVGDYFLFNNISFNKPLFNNRRLTWTGMYFLYNCAAFNQRLNMEELYQINEYFMCNCISFNQPLRFYQAREVRDMFLSGCSSFDSPIELWGSLYYIGNDFMSYCTAFDSSINANSGVTSVGDNFMRGCSGFNHSLSFLSSLQSIGNSFLRAASSFNQTLNTSNIRTIGEYFLTDAVSFNKPLTIPSTTTSVGIYFLHNCNSFHETITVEVSSSVAQTNDIYTLSTTDIDADLFQIGFTFASSNNYHHGWFDAFKDRCVSPYRHNSSAERFSLVSNGNTIYFSSSTDVCSIGQPTDTITISGQAILRSSITAVDISSYRLGVVSAHFCYNFTNLTSVALPTNLTYIGGCFLYGCSRFNQAIDISPITQIHSYFLYGCTSFNKPLDLSSVTYIEPAFLQGCSSFNQNITIPATCTSVGRFFMHLCDSFCKTITVEAPVSVLDVSHPLMNLSTESASSPLYTTGAAFAGTYAADWVATIPTRNERPYRKTFVRT